jgi:hypothetical protein
MKQTILEKFDSKLADERIKKNVDYSYTYKYNELHIICHEAYNKSIIEMAERLGIKIATIHLYH